MVRCDIAIERHKVYDMAGIIICNPQNWGKPPCGGVCIVQVQGYIFPNVATETRDIKMSSMHCSGSLPRWVARIYLQCYLLWLHRATFLGYSLSCVFLLVCPIEYGWNGTRLASSFAFCIRICTDPLVAFHKSRW